MKEGDLMESIVIALQKELKKEQKKVLKHELLIIIEQ